MSSAGKIIYMTGIMLLLAVSTAGRHPACAQEDVPYLFRPDTLTICVCGDIMMHTGQIENARMKNGGYDFSDCFRHIRELVGKADISIANMEFPIAGEPHTGYPEFSAPERIAEDVAEAGFDVLLTANNHIFDKGSKGAAMTAETYARLKRSSDVLMTGLAVSQEDLERTTPLKIRMKGFQIALLNMTYGTNRGADLHWPKTNYIGQSQAVETALGRAAGSDFVLALPHWGTEYVLEHSENQKTTALWLAEKGADMIIGAHPHVIQDTETLSLEGKEIEVVYSLGNTLSNMSAKNTQMGLMAWIRIVRNKMGDTKILPVEFTYIWCSRPGGFDDGYTILPVGRFIGRKELWKGTWDYDKMMATLERIMNATGIKDKDIKL